MEKESQHIISDKDLYANLNARIQMAEDAKVAEDAEVSEDAEDAEGSQMVYQSEECVICLAEPAIVTLPCQHKCLCKSCSLLPLKACPLCRGPYNPMLDSSAATISTSPSSF